jgi:hypothetical protein
MVLPHSLGDGSCLLERYAGIVEISNAEISCEASSPRWLRQLHNLVGPSPSPCSPSPLSPEDASSSRRQHQVSGEPLARRLT